MKHVWTITLVVALYGVAIGAILVGVPQAGLAAELGSGAIGLVGSSGALGYVAGCLAFGQWLRGVPAKRVLLGGTALTLLGTIGFSASRTTETLAACQFGVGVAGGAFWPFASAWLLEFRSEGIARTRLLRHYNVAWTVGTAAGMVAAGWLCRAGLIVETFLGTAGLLAGVLALAFVPRSPRPAPAPEEGPSPSPVASVGVPLLLAAILANVVAVGTRSMILVNYPELNKALGFEADRMGLITGLSVLAMMAAFGIGAAYESWLGLRRVYALLAAALVATLATFALASSDTPFAVLLAGAVASGLVNAVTFQGSILAATGYFAAAPRRGTTLHEAMIGLGGLFPVAGGALASFLKAGGTDSKDALRAPFLALAALAVVALAVQLLLASGRPSRRLLHEGPPRETSGGTD